MREKPILFSGPMVRAIIEGRKTQTRRICKTEVQFDTNGEPFFFVPENPKDDESFGKWVGIDEYSPHGRVGDKLWVRESFRFLKSHDRSSPMSLSPLSVVFYDADNAIGVCPDAGRLRPSIHMPRWASRITLEVTGVRVERLQDISVEDIIAEGLSTTLREHDACIHLKEQWIYLWNNINLKRAPWESNPWVWVIEFKTI